MHVRLSASLALLSLALVPACTKPKGVELQAKELVPPDANLVFGFELAPLQENALGEMLWSALASDPDVAGVGAGLTNCGVDLTKMRGMMAGMMDDHRDEFLIVVESPGIGDEKKMTCFEEEFAKATNSDAGVQLFITRGNVRAAPQADGGQLVILNSNMIAVVDGPWEDWFFEAVEDPAKRKPSDQMAAALGRVDTSAHVWAAVGFTDAERADFAGFPGADGMANLTATLDLSDGLAGTTSIGFGDPDKMKAFEESASAELSGARADVVGAGVPERLYDSMKLTPKEGALELSFNATQEEWTAMTPLLGALLAEG